MGVSASVLTPASVRAHGGTVPAPSFPEGLLAWSFDPLAITEARPDERRAAEEAMAAYRAGREGRR